MPAARIRASHAVTAPGLNPICVVIEVAKRCLSLSASSRTSSSIATCPSG